MTALGNPHPHLTRELALNVNNVNLNKYQMGIFGCEAWNVKCVQKKLNSTAYIFHPGKRGQNWGKEPGNSWNWSRQNHWLEVKSRVSGNGGRSWSLTGLGNFVAETRGSSYLCSFDNIPIETCNGWYYTFLISCVTTWKNEVFNMN